MSKRNKLLASIKNSPNNVTFSQVRKLLEKFDFTVERISGSHHVFRLCNTIFAIPVHNNRVKTVYVKRVIELIEENEEI